MKKKAVKMTAALLGGKLTAVLAGVAGFTLVLLVSMILLIPKDEEPAPTTVPTTVPTETTTTTEPVTEVPTEETEETGPKMLEHMAELYEQNPDIVGWIRIDGTKLDYPVMYTPEDEEKYIRADFEGKLDLAGTPFIDKDCTMDPESQNLLIYGHNMKDGTAFHTLFDYMQKKFLQEHPTIYFSTLYEERTYEVLAMFHDEIYTVNSTHFKFYEFIDPETEEEFQKGIDYFKKRSIYKTNLDVEYGDKLLTLVTCSYHTTFGRFVVVAREITNDVETPVVAESTP